MLDSVNLVLEWMTPDDCPCRLTAAPIFRQNKVSVLCVTHEEQVADFSWRLTNGTRANGEMEAALEPALRHINAWTPSRAPVTIAECESWGWWARDADAA